MSRSAVGQVLEFRLEDRTYCVGIEHIDEIVDRGDLTPLPGSEPHVEGVMDLRGTTTTIVNPKTVLDVDDTETGERVIVFEAGDANTGWVIDEVNQVVRIEDENVDESVESESVKAVVRRDDDLVVWVKPETIHA